MAIIAPKGTKDMLPEKSAKWHYIEREFQKIAEEYGFGEIRTPMFEATELFNRGVGETTDIVQKEMYTFEDLGHRSITLKPEGTSPAVRAFIESRHFADMQPSKYYYNTPCFRYEKPQEGRLREFHQFGVENFGASSMLADAEVIALGADFIDRMGIQEVELRINSVGCRKCRSKYRDALRAFLAPHYDQLCDTCKSRYETNPMRILDCKSAEDQAIVKDAPLMIDYLCEECSNAFEELKGYLTAMGIDYVVDPKIVRGLDYYTKTAFEFVTTKIGAQGTVCGGGRYDHLIEEIGGPDMPGVGFGLGKERLILLMEACGSEFPEDVRPEVFLAWIGQNACSYALQLVQKLRGRGIRAAIDTQGRNLKGQMKYANKIGAAYTVVLGDNEIETGELTLKNMQTGEQIKVTEENLPEMIRQ
ncbi:MAG: histidine--tRNA ligase [Mogibacterium sp.]|nr:histidine--tRNA ligase [Mogibacterium sp.]